MLVFIAGTATGQRIVTAGTATGEPGAKVRGAIAAVEHVDGSPRSLPVVVITGRRAGPVVWLQCLSHGDEYGGALALQRVVAGLDPEQLRGTVVAVMAANPAAFQGLQRVNPNLDDLADLGDVFPGRAGFATERIASAITRATDEVRPDYFVDLHTGGDRFLEHPFVFYTQLGQVPAARYDSLATFFGLPTVWRDTMKIFPRGPTTQMSERGVPAFLLEVGGGQPIRASDTEQQANAVQSFLRGVGSLPGEPVRLPRYTVVRSYRIVTNARGGFFTALVRPGDVITAGMPLGTITNVFGEVVETLRAPEGAMLVIGVSTYPAWASGGWLFEVGAEVSSMAPPIR
jgi:predicted deacylase